MLKNDGFAVPHLLPVCGYGTVLVRTFPETDHIRTFLPVLGLIVVEDFVSDASVSIIQITVTFLAGAWSRVRDNHLFLH